MSSLVSESLRNTGFAEVFALLHDETPQRPESVITDFVAEDRAIGQWTPDSRRPAPSFEVLESRAETLTRVSSYFASGLENQTMLLAAEDFAEPPPAMTFFPRLGVCYGAVTKERLVALRRDPAVAFVGGTPQFSLIAFRFGRDTKPELGPTWGIGSMRIPMLWDQGLDGTGVLVGHLDTGVDARHPTLRAAIHSYLETDRIGGAIVGAQPHDTEQHGTHTAGTIAGRPIDGYSIGVAPGAMLASATIVEGGKIALRLLAGLEWVLTQDARIVNISVGVVGLVNDFIPILTKVRRQGVLPVVAVGNDGPGASRSPGNYPQALSVGAIDRSDSVWPSSSSQRFRRSEDPVVPDLVAPGVDIISAKAGGGYRFDEGSSMATPHISGLAALLFQARPTASIDQVEQAICDSCVRPASMLLDRGNRGIPDAVEALAQLTRSVVG